MANNDFTYVLPSLGADMDEAALLEWKVKPGDRVKRGQVVAVLETVKAAIDAEIWVDGVVEELLLNPDKDRKIKVGTPLARLTTDQAVPATPSTMTTPEIKIPPTPASRTPVSPDAPAATRGTPRLMVSPAARRRMQELGLTDADLTPQDHSLGVADIEKAANDKVPGAPQTIRDAIAQAMSRSKREIPHYYLATEIDLTASLAWMRTQNEKRSLEERILPAALLIRAVALALRRYESFNGFYLKGAFHASPEIHVAMAFALREGGLIAPAIHNTDTLNIPELMKKLADVGERARTGGLKAKELSDPTITITSLGDLGVEEIFPIINPPQVAMIGFGSLVTKPLVVDGKIAAREVMRATLAADHRVSDGRDGALFLSEIKDLLEQVDDLVS